MENFLNSFLDTYHKYDIFVIPFTYGFVGWWTNWVALKMTFYPLKFWGIPPYLGWQGIIPRKAHKMASKAVDVITEKLLDIEEVFDRVDPVKVEQTMLPILIESIHESTIEFANSLDKGLWDRLPQVVRDEINFKIDRQSRECIRRVSHGLKTNIKEFFDVKALVLKNLTGPNVGLIVEMFQKVGGPEFRFIERSGFYFGFLLGLIQMVFWIFFPISWTLPLQGIIVGYLTNYLALEMIFRPLRPKVILGFSYQGLFIKRQTEVSKSYAKIVAEKILNPRNVLDEILYGKMAEEVTQYIQQAVREQVDSIATIAKPAIFTFGKYDTFIDMKHKIAQNLSEKATASSYHLEDYLYSAFDLEKSMGEKMAQLTPEEFEVILRSAFQEDEWLLILVGAVLGALVGYGQIFIL